MAASKPANPLAGTGLSKWQLALLVGAPIAVGVGAVYLWKRSRTKKSKGSDERKTPEGGASPVQGQASLAPADREQENVVMLPVHLAFTVTPGAYITSCPWFDTTCVITVRPAFLNKHANAVKEFSRTLRCKQKVTANIAS